MKYFQTRNKTIINDNKFEIFIWSQNMKLGFSFRVKRGAERAFRYLPHRVDAIAIAWIVKFE